MEIIRFIFWEGAKVLAVVFLAIVSVKSIGALALRQRWLRSLLYVVVIAMAGLAGWYAGNDVAAEVYSWSSGSSLARGDLTKAYGSALAAVRLRPNNLGYWHGLIAVKLRMQQLQSVLDDESSVRALSHGSLDGEDEYQFALCSHFLGQNDEVIATTLRLIRENPSYAAPYVLQGLAYIAQQKYPQAQQSFLAVLQMFPDNQAAVENLARACYLAGDRKQALSVLAQTTKYSFSPAARERFEALKGLYEQ